MLLVAGSCIQCPVLSHRCIGCKHNQNMQSTQLQLLSSIMRVLILDCAHLRSHEEMSGEILQTIIDDGHIKDDALDDIDMKRVQQLIVGSCHNHQPAGDGAPPLNDKRFLFDIVANGRNSIDVDKFDYLARDSHYCNVKVSCDLNRLQRLTKVSNGQCTSRP